MKTKRHDTYDVIEYQLLNNDGTPFKLENAVVYFHMETTRHQLLVNAEAEIVNEEKGMVKYQLKKGDTVLEGNHFAEFVVEMDGKVKTFPEYGYLRVTVSRKIDNDRGTEYEERVAIRVSKIEEFKNAISEEVSQFKSDVTQELDEFDSRIQANEQTASNLVAQQQQHEVAVENTVNNFKQSTTQTLNQYKADMDQTVEGYKQETDTTVETFKGQVNQNVNEFKQATTQRVDELENRQVQHEATVGNVVDDYKLQTDNTVEEFKGQVTQTVETYKQQTDQAIETHKTETVQEHVAHVEAVESTVNEFKDAVNTTVAEYKDDVEALVTDYKAETIDKTLEIEERSIVTENRTIETEGKVDNLQKFSSQRLGELEQHARNLEESNVNREERVTLNNFRDINHLPKNAADGTLFAELRGVTATNIIKNGNFSLGLINLTTVRTNLEIINQELVGTNTGNNDFRIRFNDLFKAGHRYFIFMRVKTNHQGTGRRIFIGSSFGHIYSETLQIPTGEYGKISGIFNVSEDGHLTIQVGVSGGAEPGETVSVDGKTGVLAIDMTALGLTSLSKEQMDEMFSHWFGGLKHTEAKRVKSVGENLLKITPFEVMGIDITKTNNSLIINPRENSVRGTTNSTATINSILTGESGFSGNRDIKKLIKLEKNSTYTLLGSFYRNLEAVLINDDGTISNTVVFSYSGTTVEGDMREQFNTGERNIYLDIRRRTSGSPYAFEFRNLMLVRSAYNGKFEPYQETTQYFPEVGKRLPNSVADTVNSKGEVVKRVKEVKLDGSWNWVNYLATNGYKTVYFVNQEMDQARNTSSRIIKSDSSYELKYINSTSNPPADDVFFVTSANAIVLSVRNTITGFTDDMTPTNQQWRDFFNSNPYTLFYRLAQPIITNMPFQKPLLSKPSGTVYIENAVADYDFYIGKLTVSNTKLPIRELETIIKFDKETGVETHFNPANAVIAGDKLSFTHTGLTEGDLVWWSYKYPDELTTNSEKVLQYYDSRYAVVDDTNGKIYRWKIKSSNGVPSVELVEI